jgi:hypothetical protein
MTYKWFGPQKIFSIKWFEISKCLNRQTCTWELVINERKKLHEDMWRKKNSWFVSRALIKFGGRLYISNGWLGDPLLMVTCGIQFFF